MNKTEICNHAKKRIQEIKTELEKLEREKQVLMNNKTVDVKLLQQSEQRFETLANEAEHLARKIKQHKN